MVMFLAIHVTWICQKHRLHFGLFYFIQITIMQESNEEKDILTMSVEEMFLASQESFEEAQQRAIEESKSFNKTEFFRMDKLGTYRLRMLPIAPNRNGGCDRQGYEYPVRQLLLELVKPTKDPNSKSTSVYVSATRATDAGYSVDLIDTYRKLAVSAASDRGDEKLAEKIGGGSFGGGLKYGYGHAVYIIDLNERAKGIQMLTLSHSQFKELDERRFKLWQKKLSKSPGYPCPISSVYNAYAVEIEKKKNGSKTEYAIEIDNESDVETLTNEELTKLMNMPRIPEVIYRYNRYIYEATIEFLKQCDRRYELAVMDTLDMRYAIDKIAEELPKEDTSSFSFDKRTKDSRDNAESSSGISLDDLFVRYDELTAEGLNDKSEEGQELKAMIRTFIDQEKLNIRVTRSTTNKMLLDEIEAALEGASSDSEEEADKVDSQSPDSDLEEKEETTSSRRRR